VGVIRKLVTVLALDSTAALKGLVAYGRQWQAIEKVVANAAASVEKNADRAAAAMARMASGAAQVRASGGGGSSGGGSRGRSTGGAGRRGGDDLDRAISRANVSTARQGGLQDGAKAIREATAALGPLATKSDRAKAAVADLAAQVARNRREMADLRAETVRNGDDSGRLKARMQGLATATGQASVALQGARKTLRDVDGGLIDAVKNAGKLRERFGALQVAAGNLIAGGLSAAFRGVTGAIVGSTEKAIKFESSLISISKVARGADDTKAGFERITAGIKDTSKALGVLPTEVAELTAQLAPVFSDVSEGADGAKVDLVALTGDVTKIGVAWDISGAQAGKAFADISRGLGTTTAETKSLFGGINELGNQLGTKAADVAEAVQRSAGVLKGANLSGETGAALNATLIAAGSSAEVAATGVRTFVARLGAGEAATKKQLHAFKELGLSAKDVSRELTSGDSVRAEKQIKAVVAAIGGLADDKRLPVLIELFGSESIGSIGAAATATDLLGKSFAIMGDKAASATSVQKEFDRVGQTTAAKVAKLKANVEVLAIEFGEALLPHINKVVEFLTSAEGQEWGRGAVEKAVGAVSSLATGIGFLVSTVTTLTDAFGGTAVAIGAVAIGAASLVGPFGAALLAGTAAGWGIAAAFQGAMDAIGGTTQLIDGAERLRVDAMGRKLGDIDAAGKEENAKTRAREVRVAQARKAGVDLELAVVRKAGVKNVGELDEATRLSLTTRQSKLGIAAQEGRGFEEELGAVGGQTAALSGAGGGAGGHSTAGDQARFNALSEKVRKGIALRPSEAKEYTALSKSLDEAKARKAGKGHKATKMDRQLAAIGGDVRGVLTGGGERDAGGDLMVHDDALSRSVFDRATKGNGQGKDRSDGAGIGPGPNVTTNYDNRSYVTTVNVDAKGRESSADNLRSAAEQVASRTATAVTGGAKLAAMINAGGVMRG